MASRKQMPAQTRKELQQRVAELEDALERVCNVSDCALQCETGDDDDDE